MNREDVIRMAREAGLERIVYTMPCGASDWLVPDYERLERFAALVAAAEREFRKEALALLNTIHMGNESQRSQDIIRAAIRKLQSNAPEELANAIRARGQQ